MRVGLLAVAAVVAACYSPSFAPCSIACDGESCPRDMTCKSDGYCHGPGELLCQSAIDGSVIDGSSSPDADCRVSVLLNGGFEDISGTGDDRTAAHWTETFLPANPFFADGEGSPSFVAHAGTHGVRFAGDNLDGLVAQRLGELPAGTRHLEISMFYRSTGTEDVIDKDTVTFSLVDIASPTTVALAGLDGVEETTDWSLYRVVVDVTPAAGQEWDFAIEVVSGSTKPTRFELDDLQLDAIVCDP